MIALPPLPGWDDLHPLVIHFPIVLLLIAPLFILIGAAVAPPHGRPYLHSALLLMVLGTVAVWFAVATGEATADLVERNPQVVAALERHEDLADSTRIVFTVATIIFAIAVFAPRVWQRDTTRLFSTVVPLVFAVLYGAAALLLVNTAHQGGRLVHELGTSPPAVATDSAPAPVEND
jgi:uncharacterized membrane protein